MRIMRSLSLGVLFGVLPLVAGCQVVQMFQEETDKAVDMVGSPFRNVKILSYNIRAGLGLDDVRDISRAAKVILESDVDVVAVQEIDRKTERAKGVDQFEELVRLTEMQGTWCKTIDYQGGEYGIAILSRDKPLNVRRIKLPSSGEPRMLVLAEFPRYIFCATHLPLDEKDRLECLPILTGLAKSAKPLFIAGDWNDVPSSPFIKGMRKSFALVSAYDSTFPADKPDRCIDYVAVSYRHRAKFEHVEHRVLNEPLISDHRPIFVKLR